ncbi:hypothetical protein C440_07227 [Haloferax mucosum ATCC BAA-1512]|uniref:Uncharacterized protein n=1 Tax=Haloferax mucosum ATCC BAA-1512 TaxID=662479 RepID=M0IG68_9EURY|nr:hypothetical protein C440_07227 [Haloferax mucosum ATCC BAA-1512]
MVEVGIGRESAVAAELAERGVEVVAIDVHEFPVPDGVRFVRDDVFAREELSNPGPYEDADAIYALNIPVELHRPTAHVARRVGADFLFTTLGYDEPSIPVSREALPGDTLYVADGNPRSQE